MNFKGKTVAITGGTGSFGNAMLKRLLTLDTNKIIVISRDEEKQDRMRRENPDSRISFVIGDIRDYFSFAHLFESVHYVFHAAALKQVPSCEFFPLQAVQTNIMGTENVVRAVCDFEVEAMVLLSTDKAVYPVNAMGMSKAMAEKIIQAKARNLVKNSKSRLMITRYGNVLASRGSVLPLFFKQARSGKQLTITDPSMTRFLMTLEDSIDLVLYAFEHGETGDIFVKKSNASTIQNLAEAVAKICNVSNDFKIIGSRHGEKMYETLISPEEMSKAIDHGGFYQIPVDDRDLNYDLYFDIGSKVSYSEYNSNNTHQLSVDDLVPLIKPYSTVSN